MSALLDAGAVLKEARRRVGMTQVDLARTAGVTQSVVSAYESGARQPSLVTLQRLVSAAGFELVISLSPQAARRDRLTGPLGRRVLRERRRLTEVAARHGASNVRVFGSVARGAEGPDSDVDLLADLAPGTGLLGLGRLEHDLADVLHARVDVVPATDLKPGVAESVLSEAIPL
ncbi:MAG TPA: helix-turn-helix domain-containing protein [Jiangellales bacterium]|nr:helix-turn-helix domain-containing protein [Jiangellales bacterium]